MCDINWLQTKFGTGTKQHWGNAAQTKNNQITLKLLPESENDKQAHIICGVAA